MTDAIRFQPSPTDQGAAVAQESLRSLLVAGESVVAWALQHRLYALVHRRNLAAATTGRFIFVRRPLLGGYEPLSVRWQDIKDVRLDVGMFSASVTIAYSANLSDTAIGEGDLCVVRASGLNIEPAQALYRECQAQDQAWREKRRVRSIEEMRARAGGVQIATGVYPGAGPDRTIEGPHVSLPSGPADDPALRLARARDMLVQGLITDSEYETIKARIVGSL
jgi:hypothetical protein